ncbi:MAG: family 16 glycosylhydrolase, partial [Lachnospiraceae bacterium]|nr:family 16 glycosylhydrolase [Lachnospiraceae bacterium]
MKREMRKVVSAVTTVAMVATLFSGVSFDRTANAATGDSVALKPWKFYQTGTTTDSSNPWELNAFKSVTFGNSGVANLTESSFTHYDVWSPEYNANPGSDEKTVTAGGVTDTFSAFIESNGWTADYNAKQNNPYTLSAYMDGIQAKANTSYAFSFKANARSTNGKVKHIQIAASDAANNVLVSKVYTLDSNNQTCGITYSVPTTQNVKLSILMGAFPIENDKVKIAEVNYEGIVEVSETTIKEGEYDTSLDAAGPGYIPPTNKTQIPNGYTYNDLVWSDEFTAKNLDTDYWTYEIGHGNGGWGNGESQYYTDSKDNVYITEVNDDYYGSIDNSALAIKAKREGEGFTSGRIKSANKVQFKYGYVEAKIKMDNGMASGVWPAFWMLGTSNNGNWPGCGEFDIMEHSNAENLVYCTLHWEGNGHEGWGLTKNFSRGDMNDWHKYAMEWDENTITMFMDGAKVLSMGRSEKTDELFNSEGYLLLNVAIGGQFINWAMPSDSWSSSTMYVDYVRVYQKQDTHNKSLSANWKKSDYWKNFNPNTDISQDEVVYTGEANGINGWTHIHKGVSPDGNDAAVEVTQCTDLKTGFMADVSITGWSAYWEPPTGFPGAVGIDGVYGDTPNQLRSETTVDVKPGQTYNFGFDVSNHMLNSDGNGTEKNVTVVIRDENDNQLYTETIRVSADGKNSYSTRVTIPSNYSGNIIKIELDYGCYFYSCKATEKGMTNQVSNNPYLLAPGTTEPINATGLISFKNVYCLTDADLASKVTEAEVDSSKVITGWRHSHEPVEQNDAAVGNTVCSNTDTGFAANVGITGWQGYWEAPADYPNAVKVGNYYGDNPYQLHSYAVKEVQPGNTYKLNMDIINKMYGSGGSHTEKNVTVTVTSGEDGDYDNVFYAKTLRINPKSTYKLREKIEIPASYNKNTVKIMVAYGCYAYSFNATVNGNTEEVKGNPYLLAPGTVENLNATGKLTFDKTLFYLDDGRDDDDVEPPTETQKPSETVSQKPSETVSQKPSETVSQKPSETQSQSQSQSQSQNTGRQPLEVIGLVANCISDNTINVVWGQDGDRI